MGIFKSNNSKNELNVAKPKNKQNSIMKKYGIFLIFLLMCAVLSILTPNFLTVPNLVNVIRQISMIAIIATGSTIIMISGGIDLSPGSVVALSGICAAFIAKTDGYPVIVPVIVGLGIGALCGFLSGFIISKGNMAPFIVTLGMMSIARGLSFVLTEGKPVSGLTKSFTFIGRGSILYIPTPIFILAFIMILTHIILSKLKFGKYAYAIGGNEIAAKVSGLNIDRTKILVYTYGGLMSGVAGLVLTARVISGQPNAGLGYEFDAITATVIGGTSMSGGVGNVLGTLVGALIIGVLNNGLDILGVSSYYQQIAKGLIIVLAVFLDTRKNKR